MSSTSRQNWEVEIRQAQGTQSKLTARTRIKPKAHTTKRPQVTERGQYLFRRRWWLSTRTASSWRLLLPTNSSWQRAGAPCVCGNPRQGCPLLSPNEGWCASSSCCSCSLQDRLCANVGWPSLCAHVQFSTARQMTYLPLTPKLCSSGPHAIDMNPNSGHAAGGHDPQADGSPQLSFYSTEPV